MVFSLYSLFILSLALALSAARLHAQQPQITYLYDDLGRLLRVVNQNNECATYNYDAVGNLLSITRSTNCLQPPNITGLSQGTAQAGGTTCITLTGNNFLGATISSDNPDIQPSRVRVSETSIDACLNISLLSALGSTRLLITTAGGTADSPFTISPKIVSITQNTTIGKTNQSFDNTALIINGAITVTIDGAHHFDSLALRNGALVTHPGTSNLHLTVSDTLQIDSTSRIDVTARGYLGGNQPGNPFGKNGMTYNSQSGSTGTSGGGFGGLGGISYGVSNPVYGDFRDPHYAGSGGSSTDSNLASNGGGLVRIVADTLQLDGLIKADGETRSCCYGGGSGGGIRIDAFTLKGTGQITAKGSNATYTSGGGGGGRVAIYYQDTTGFDLTRISAYAGLGGGGGPNGGAGTIYLQGPGREAGELLVDNNNVVAASFSTPVLPPTGTISLTHFRARRAARVRVDSILSLTGTLEVASGAEFSSTNQTIADNVNLNTSALISHPSTTGTVSFKVDLSANTLTVDATSKIDVTGRGFLGGNQPGNPFGKNGMTSGFQNGSTMRAGGSYGGLGGVNTGEGVVNPVYGDFRNPNEVGSGGAVPSSSTAGNGGGLIRIVAQSFQLDGALIANAGSFVGAEAGGASGGGIRIDAGTLTGAGQIIASGNNGAYGSGGGGGRIAIYYQDVTGFNLANVNAWGGLGGSGRPNGGAGTIYLQGPGREAGELIIDSNNRAVASLSTPIPNPVGGSISLTHLRVRRSARIRLDSVLTLTGTLEIGSSAEFNSTNATTAATINVTGGSLITHLPTTGTASFKVDLNANSLTVDGTSKIDVTGRGFLGGNQPGNSFGKNGMTIGFQSGSTVRAGGSYGGLGGVNTGEGVVNPLYGDFRNPNEVGSGGAVPSSSTAGNGGGLIRIVAQTFQLDGALIANAGSFVGAEAGGASGGGIGIDAGTLSGAGQITANGGNGLYGGGGGGGRIAIYYQTVSGFNFARVTASGGLGGNSRPNGQIGSIYLEQTFALLTPAGANAPVLKTESGLQPTNLDYASSR